MSEGEAKNAIHQLGHQIECLQQQLNSHELTAQQLITQNSQQQEVISNMALEVQIFAFNFPSYLLSDRGKCTKESISLWQVK